MREGFKKFMNARSIFHCFISILICVLFIGQGEGRATISDSKKAEIKAKIGGIRIPFIQNNGQINNKVAFYAHTFGGTVFVTKSGKIIYNLPKSLSNGGHGGVVIKEEFINKKQCKVKGIEQAVTRINYFIGKDKTKWQKDMPSYNIVSLGEIYQGIEVRLKAHGNNVEKLFYISTGANPEKIRVKVRGSSELKIAKDGSLEVITELGKVRFTRPIAYQEIKGKRHYVKVSYVVTGNEYGFYIGNYDKKHTLIIDPLLASTFLGGGSSAFAHALAIDQEGNVYVAGYTYSDDFPTTQGAYDTSGNSYCDVFISKLDGNLHTLLASTFLGGENRDEAHALAIDQEGNVYVAGYTESDDFPTTQGAYDTSGNGYCDVFISKLDGNLHTLLASTFLGGGDYDYARTLAIDQEGNVYVAGYTYSDDFPTTQGAYDTSATVYYYYYDDHVFIYHYYEVFISKLDGNLHTLLASTFLGGGSSYAYALAIDQEGNVYVAGYTYSDDFPTTQGAYNTSGNGKGDVFISKLDGNLHTLLASTFLGGGEYDYAYALAIDQEGNVYVAGYTESDDFPTTQGAYDTSGNSYCDVFISKLDGNLHTLLASTFLGGENRDEAHALAIDQEGNVYVAGYTESDDFPTTQGAYNTIENDKYDCCDEYYPADVFISKLDSNLQNLLASTFLGGENRDEAHALAIDQEGNVYVAGYTESNYFPVTEGAYDEISNITCEEYYEYEWEYSWCYKECTTDAFISKLNGDLSADVNVKRSRVLYDRIHHCFFVYLTFTAKKSFTGPVRMVLTSSTIPLRTDESSPGLEPDGYTDDDKPYFTIVPDGEEWEAGESIEKIRLDFQLKRKKLDFTLKFESQ